VFVFVLCECQHHDKDSRQELCTRLLGSLIPLSGTNYLQTAQKEIKQNYDTQI